MNAFEGNEVIKGDKTKMEKEPKRQLISKTELKITVLSDSLIVRIVSCESACDLKVKFQNNNSNGGINFKSIITHCNRKDFMFFCNSETFFSLLIHTFYYNHMISIQRTQVLCTLNRINFVTGTIDGDIQMIFNVKQLQAVLLRYDHLRLFLTTNRIPVELRVPNLVFLILSVYICV